MTDKVRAKKHLGQHFLNDENIARIIADTLTLEGYNQVLEIGPGMGVLTKYLLEKPITTFVVEIDTESVAYLQAHYPLLSGRILSKDFLKYDVRQSLEAAPFAIIGNFPYNISSQIVFKLLEMKIKFRSSLVCFKRKLPSEFAKNLVQKPMGFFQCLHKHFMMQPICLLFLKMYLHHHLKLRVVYFVYGGRNCISCHVMNNCFLK